MAEFFKPTTTTSFAGVTILAPTTSTVTGTAVHASATATGPTPITAMRIYVDNVSVYVTSASQINTTVNMATGTHNVVFQAWDTTGTVYKTAKTITVQ
jgi:hypothetical protein